MSDDEDSDDLPPISVNSSNHDMSLFIMPSAGEVATQRARAEHCERQLLRLREEHSAQQAEVAALAHSDSSGSEGEAALAAAVGALRVKPAPRAAPPTPAALVAAAAPRLQPASRLLARYLRASSAARDDAVALALEAAAAAADWEPGEAAGAALWALCALAARRPATARLAHALFEDALDESAARAVADALDEGLEEPRARLALHDALAGGGRRARALAARLVCGAQPADRYAALQAAARALAAAPDSAPERRRLAALLAAPRTRDAGPDELRVVVAATKLRVLLDVGE